MVTYLLRIKGFSPDTLPLSRLGEYLCALAELVGPDAPVHFDKVTKGSALLKMKAPDDQAPAIESRVRLAPAADPGTEGRRGYDRLQQLLGEDQTSAEFRADKGAVILQFPGVRRLKPARTASVREYSELHGRIIRLGGRDSTVPVGLQLSDGAVVNCTATLEQARQLKSYLLEPIDVLLTGVGRWTRDESGQWEVADFKISDCTPMQYGEFDAEFAKVRSGGSGWDAEDDLEAALHRIRYGD
ncbi:hypothetical protein [Thauera phenylacetica]|uniref:hypothetical protein n=1 Tax=Thauera phenylacetica TaxID=164400 RepID=UPI0012F977DF|nr:hypothetical protein [Thauera phenylacetica]